MRRIIARSAAVLVILISASCGGDSPTSPSPATLAGTWKASRAEFASASNPAVKVEAIGQGYTIVLTLDGAGTYSQAVTEPGHGPSTTTGTWSASKDVLTLKPAGVSFSTEFDMTWSGNTLTLNGGHVLFDVNNDDADEEAILNLSLARQ